MIERTQWEKLDICRRWAIALQQYPLVCASLPPLRFSLFAPTCDRLWANYRTQSLLHHCLYVGSLSYRKVFNLLRPRISLFHLASAKMFALLAILPVVAQFALAQSSGTLTLSSTSGCIVLSQVASLSTPYSLTQSLPICPGSPATVTWPLSSGGNGAASNMAIYANINNGSPGCVMALSQMQAMYLLGRSLEWRADGLWDNGEQGLIRDPTSFSVITWSVTKRTSELTRQWI